MQPARARVLYGYLGNNKLKVRATKSYDLMSRTTLRRWITSSDGDLQLQMGILEPAARPPLSSIPENEDEIDADVACEKADVK